MKARLLIEGFRFGTVWGWKDPRNSLTLPFWEDLLPGLKTLIIVRNPLEVAYSMRKRNGTSYAFGLRLWEIYNRRLIEAAGKHDRLVTHYDLFFENAEKELQRIANFVGLPDAKIHSAAELVATKRRHTHFTIDQLVDAGVSGEVIELYRALIARSLTERRKTSVAKSGRRCEVTRDRFTSRRGEPARFLRSRPLRADRASVRRAPCANRSAAQERKWRNSARILPIAKSYTKPK